MNSNLSLKNKKSGKKFSDFCFVVLFLLSCGLFANNIRIIEANNSIKNKETLSISPFSKIEIRIPSFQFKKNSIDLLDSMYQGGYYPKTTDELDIIYKMLLRNPTMILEASGHASSDEKNQEALSLKRAEVIKQILVDQGIPADRIITKGYGITKLKITDAQIAKAKTKKEKEILNQINRRVVFKILSWDYIPKEK